MLLNRMEYVLMNSPLRPLVQRYFEARRLLRMGGAMSGGRALVSLSTVIDVKRPFCDHAT